MSDKLTNLDEDPDYLEFHEKQQIDRSKIQEINSKDQTIKRIENILTRQFMSEIEYKINEVNIINHRVRTIQGMLDRLRAYVVASYYGSGEKVVPVSKSVEKRKRKIKHQLSDDVNEDSIQVLAVNTVFQEKLSNGDIESPVSLSSSKIAEEDAQLASSMENNYQISNRFYINSKVIVGNVSKYLLSDSRKENDKSTHKWMVYVRGPAHEPDISHYVKAVWFFLHPSYIPNDIVQVNKAPFQITRRGWGEFPVRVQLHFKDGRNKRFDIIHNLKLDKTYTGLQTLGAETVVNLELHRHSKVSEDSALSLAVQSSLCGALVNKDNSNVNVGKPVERQKSNDVDIAQANLLKISTPFADKSSTILDKPVVINESFTNIKKIDEVNNCTTVAKPNALFNTITMAEFSNSPSAVSSCMTSASISRCNSPELKQNGLVPYEKNIISDEQDILLRKLIPFFPIINPLKNVITHPYSCLTFDMYKEWSFSRRRASEWQRALGIRKAYIEHVGTKNKTVPSIKQIMLWCRYNNFTPAEDKFHVIDHRFSLDYVDEHCMHCGLWRVDDIIKQGSRVSILCNQCQKLFDRTYTFSTRCVFTDILDEIKNKEKTVSSLRQLEIISSDQKDQIENDIDVVSICKEAKSLPTSIRYEISSSDDLDWIYDTCHELGVHLSTSMYKNVKGPFVSMILLASVKHFISELVRKSNSESMRKNKLSFNPGLVTVASMASTVTKVKKFDFLLESGLGKYAKEDDEES